MFRFLHSSKVAPEPSLPEPLLVITHTDREPIWKGFATIVKAENNENEFTMDYTVPGDLAYELAGLCEREGANELTSEKIMYFSEVTNYLLLLKKEDETIGFLLLDCYPGVIDAKIWLVCVSSKYKGKKYSTLLINKAKQIARDVGKTEIHLEALTHTIGTKVYKPLGFRFNSMRRNNMTANLTTTKGGSLRNVRNTRKKKRTS